MFIGGVVLFVSFISWFSCRLWLVCLFCIMLIGLVVSEFLLFLSRGNSICFFFFMWFSNLVFMIFRCLVRLVGMLGLLLCIVFMWCVMWISLGNCLWCIVW